MSISLSDIPAAVADYIKNNVTVAVSAVKHSGSTVLQPTVAARVKASLPPGASPNQNAL